MLLRVMGRTHRCGFVPLYGPEPCTLSGRHFTSLKMMFMNALNCCSRSVDILFSLDKLTRARRDCPSGCHLCVANGDMRTCLL